MSSLILYYNKIYTLQRGYAQNTSLHIFQQIHFEEGQFEQHRQDGLKKLKPNAIPTRFDIPNPLRLLETKRKSLYKVYNIIIIH